MVARSVNKQRAYPKNTQKRRVQFVSSRPDSRPTASKIGRSSGQFQGGKPVKPTASTGVMKRAMGIEPTSAWEAIGRHGFIHLPQIGPTSVQSKGGCKRLILCTRHQIQHLFVFWSPLQAGRGVGRLHRVSQTRWPPPPVRAISTG